VRVRARLDAEAARLRRLAAFAEIFDARFRIAGIGWRFGLDSIAGLGRRDRSDAAG
jgi:hypothetical protein